MKRWDMRKMTAGAALAMILAAPAAAQVAPASPAPAIGVDTTPIDPARVAAARPVVEKLLPAGIYRQIMSGTLDNMFKMIGDEMGKMPLADIAAIGGITTEQAEALGDAKIGEVMAIYDPHWKERFELTMRAMFDSMGGMMDKMEPRMREGLVRAYARNYSADQLNELASFFATPTGNAYASKSLLIMMDPEMMQQMQEAIPEMMQQMPAIMAAAAKATESLPAPRKVEDYTAAERAKLARLLGVKPSDLRDPES